MKSYKVKLDADDREIIEGIVNNYNTESLLCSSEDATLYVVLTQIIEQDGDDE